MRKDIASWCRACLTCAARHVGRSVKLPLTPIPVGGPFDHIRVDVLQLPLTKRGNKYALVFMDYLTKWPEVFAIHDQTAPTIARHLVEHVITRHRIPTQILSDRGANFLSGFMTAIHDAMGIQRANTTVYHAQTDRLVERFNPRPARNTTMIGTSIYSLYSLYIAVVHRPPRWNLNSFCYMAWIQGCLIS